jgi:hypothetical protein
LLLLVEISFYHRDPDIAAAVLVSEVARHLLPELDRRGSRLGLRELAAAAHACGLDGAAFAGARFDMTWGDDYAFEVERLWPFYAEQPRMLALALGVGGLVHAEWPPAGAAGRRIAAIEILAALPTPPEDWLARLWELTLESPWDDHHAARQYLAARGEVAARIATALATGSKPARRGAAEWLGRGPGVLRDAAVATLAGAYAAEREGRVRLAIAEALERRGAPLLASEGREPMREWARRAAQVPRQLDWVRWEALPAVRWAEPPGEDVPAELVRGLLVEAFRGRDPRPSPELAAAISTIAAADRAELALWVLRNWLDHDRQGKSDLFGLAALVAAAGDERAVELAEASIRQHSGTLTARCRALVRMLATLDHPAALRVLLALQATLRTASVRKEAAEAVTFLAERRGFTPADLEDAAVPRLGLAPDGTLSLGEGGAVLRLRDDLGLEVLAGEPPAAELARLRRELGKAWSAQLRRLEEAMVTGRAWPVSSWRESLWGHPLLRVACRRLVWTLDEAASGSWRPVTDGRGVDARGDEVPMRHAGRLRLAHRLLLGEEAAEAWRRQRDAGAFAPALDQLRPAHRMTADEEGSRLHEIPGSQWIEVDRKRASRLIAARGYVRGRGYDSGELFRYLKPFPAADLVAYLEVCEMGTEARPTLQPRGFCFSRAAARSATAEGFDIPRLRFAQVPPVLLAETRQDLEDLLALGAVTAGSTPAPG